MSADAAREGVEDGTYYLSLTMPGGFSARIASSSGDAPETSALQVRTNDANNYIVGQISRTVFSELRTAASTDATRTFLDKIFISFSDIHGKTKEAAEGADKLKAGADRAKTGSKKLAEGLRDAKDGSSDLAGGLKRLDTGSDDLERGAGQVADGTQVLADQVNAGAAKVRPFLKDNGETIGDTARLVSDSTAVVRRHLGDLVETAPGAARDARAASERLNAVYGSLCEDALVPSPHCPALRDAQQAAATTARIAGDLDRMVVKDHKGDVAALDGHLRKLQQQAGDLARRAPRLDEDLDDAVARINRLNSGAKEVSKGAGRLHTGLTRAKAGSTDLDSGVGRLKTGARSLDGGMFKLVDGTGDLAGGLHDGVEQIPDYRKKDRDERTRVMADPVRLASQPLHKAPNYGTGFAPYFIPLSLWVGAMVAYMLIQPVNRRALAAGSPARRIAFAGWLPVAALGALQSATLLSVLHWGLGLEMARPAGTVAFLLLVTGCFAAIVQWLNARFGAAGRILVLAVLMLQLTSAGGTYPVQTSPSFFHAIHPFLPMSYIVESLRRLISGGGLGPVWQACLVLVAFTLGALALTALSARRQQLWTLDRLHPELSL